MLIILVLARWSGRIKNSSLSSATKYDLEIRSIVRCAYFFLFNTLVCLYHQKLGAWGLERNCSFLSLPFICMIICLCRRNLPLEIQDSVTYSLFLLTFPALSFVALPLTASSISLLSNSPSVIDCCSPSSYWLISFSHASFWFPTSSEQSSEDESFAKTDFH